MLNALARARVRRSGASRVGGARRAFGEISNLVGNLTGRNASKEGYVRRVARGSRRARSRQKRQATTRADLPMLQWRTLRARLRSRRNLTPRFPPARRAPP